MFIMMQHVYDNNERRTPRLRNPHLSVYFAANLYNDWWESNYPQKGIMLFLFLFFFPFDCSASISRWIYILSSFSALNGLRSSFLHKVIIVKIVVIVSRVIVHQFRRWFDCFFRETRFADTFFLWLGGFALLFLLLVCKGGEPRRDLTYIHVPERDTELACEGFNECGVETLFLFENI